MHDDKLLLKVGRREGESIRAGEDAVDVGWVEVPRPGWAGPPRPVPLGVAALNEMHLFSLSAHFDSRALTAAASSTGSGQ